MEEKNAKKPKHHLLSLKKSCRITQEKTSQHSKRSPRRGFLATQKHCLERSLTALLRFLPARQSWGIRMRWGVPHKNIKQQKVQCRVELIISAFLVGYLGKGNRSFIAHTVRGAVGEGLRRPGPGGTIMARETGLKGIIGRAAFNKGPGKTVQ